MNDHDDQLLDACLDEVLGGQSPPDLSAQILHAWQTRSNGASDANRATSPGPVAIAPITPAVGGTYLPAAILNTEPLPPPVQAPRPALIEFPEASSISMRRKKAPRSTLPAVWTIASTLVAVLIVSGFWLMRNPGKDGSSGSGVAKQQKPDGEPQNDKAPRESKTAIVQSNSPEKSAVQPQDRSPDKPVVTASPDPSTFAVEPPFAVKPGRTHDRSARHERYSAAPDEEVIAFINTELKSSWGASRVTPAAMATDSEWCRRTFLRLLGRIPTVTELERFVGGSQANKRERLVDEVLDGSEYHDEFARHWSSVLANVLVGRSGGTTGDGLASREGLLDYLRQALLRGMPYDKLAYELIAATGSNKPGSEDYNGAVNYLLANMSDKGTLATTRTSQVFLGVHIQCAQCHQHPANTLAQDQFWQLNAFFRQLAVDKDDSGAARLVNRDFRGERGDPDEAEVYFENAHGQMRVAYPVFFVDGTDLPHSGVVEEVDRRTELAELIVRTDNLSRAAVNRLWAHFCGYGFTRPVDDIGPHNPPSHPELLDRLAHEFAGHGYDLKRVMRWIALSDAFGRSSKIGAENVADAPDQGTVPLFSRYYTRQMQAEELYQSLQVLADSRRTGGVREQEQAKLAWLGQFTRNMGTDEGMEEHLFNGSIPQSLFLMNGELTRSAVSTEQGSMLARVAQSKLKPEQKIEHLFESAVSRKPTKRELSVARELITARGGDELSALQDLWWALLNSNEFILDH